MRSFVIVPAGVLAEALQVEVDAYIAAERDTPGAPDSDQRRCHAWSSARTLHGIMHGIPCNVG